MCCFHNIGTKWTVGWKGMVLTIPGVIFCPVHKENVDPTFYGMCLILGHL